ncbi:MAG: cyanophycinase [Gemmatimonadota bacterium]
MTPARSTGGSDRGFIIPVGGAEEKTLDRTILRRFTELCGGEQARIAVIPTASRLEDTGPHYETLFEELGAERVWNHNFATRADCRSPEALAHLESATGIFLSGGNQLRLSTTLGGTPVARAIRRLSASGVHVAGTSAGAAFLPEHMIAFGDEGPTPRADMVTLAPGLGLTNHVVVDQHFRQRDRLGRLITALAYNPFAIGVGLDEDTAAFIGPDDVLHVTGSGAITIVDPNDVEYSSMDSSHRHDPVSVVGLRLHILTDGATYDLGRRLATHAPAPALSEPSAPSERSTEKRPGT